MVIFILWMDLSQHSITKYRPWLHIFTMAHASVYNNCCRQYWYYTI